MAKIRRFEDDKTLSVITYLGDVTKADIYHKASGLHARGNAKRYHADAYSSQVGLDIAYSRAIGRLADKLVDYTIKNLAPVR